MFFVYSVLRAFRPISGRALKLNLKQWISSEQYSTICMAWSPSLNAIEKLVEIKFQEREKGTMTLCKVARHTAKQTLHQTRSWASQTDNCTNCAHYWLGRLCTLIECDVFLQSGLIFKIGPLCRKQFEASESWDRAAMGSETGSDRFVKSVQTFSTPYSARSPQVAVFQWDSDKTEPDNKRFPKRKTSDFLSSIQLCRQPSQNAFLL